MEDPETGEEYSCVQKSSYCDMIPSMKRDEPSCVSLSRPRISKQNHPATGQEIHLTGDPEKDKYLISRRSWEDRYRFFSRPYDLTSHLCGGFDNIRMQNCFDQQYSQQQDSLPNDEPPIPDYLYDRQMRKRMQDCESMISRSRSLTRDGGHSHGGYKWSKYTYFSQPYRTRR
jgi:hypothetical protein